jgi:carboxypeptidase C (cathepsin A)
VITTLRLFKIIPMIAFAIAANAQAQDKKPIIHRTALSQSYTTHHELNLPGRTIKFTAIAENAIFTEPRGFPRAEIVSVSYMKDSPNPAARPVTFVMNGGPGASSAYLNLLAIGPWRMLLSEARSSQSLTTLQPNAETWLDFTDLVFIDPPGTGYSRVTGGDKVREQFHSVRGDIDGLVEFIRIWLKERGRVQSPAYFVGASYGGFRGPLLARELRHRTHKGFNGLILVSPALDMNLLPFGRGVQSPWLRATVLPSLAAIWAERNSIETPDFLQEAEAYASSEYMADLARGADDSQAIDRIAKKLERLTGIHPDVTKNSKGRIDVQAYTRDLERRPAPNLGGYNIHEASRIVEYSEDYKLDDVTRAIVGKMDGYFRDLLKFQTSERYQVLNAEVIKTWNWNNARYGAEAISALQQTLIGDRSMRVLIAHGASDLTTPYYATKILAAQVDAGQPRRMDFKLYDGNHLFYTREASRKALRTDVQMFFESKGNN